MSDVFFEVLDMPRPDYNLGVGSATHTRQTAEMMRGLEDVFEKEKPDLVLVYGDTNSTLAGALVASKMGRPLGHVEAGLRSFNRSMPEEINRVVADHLSALLFCPTQTAVDNLTNEGVIHGVHLVGDVMYDVALQSAQAARSRDITERFGVKKGEYLLVTLHRPRAWTTARRSAASFTHWSDPAAPSASPSIPAPRRTPKRSALGRRCRRRWKRSSPA